jgi:predicted Zn-dependent protease
LIAALLGHALVATDDDDNLPEAARVLKSAVNKDRDNPFAWYQLGVVYARQGDTARAALATAERYQMTGQPERALLSAEAAMAGIKQGTPDWLRAQDISMVARVAADRNKKKR